MAKFDHNLIYEANGVPYLLKAVPVKIMPRYPNADKYIICSNDGKWMLAVDDPRIKDGVVKALKKIHGIRDPWDDDPDYFKDYKVEYVPEKAEHEGRLFKIIADENWQVGYYLYLYDGDTCIADYLYETSADAKWQAYEEFGVPLESWHSANS